MAARLERSGGKYADRSVTWEASQEIDLPSTFMIYLGTLKEEAA